jgi:hypothetical protein
MNDSITSTRTWFVASLLVTLTLYGLARLFLIPSLAVAALFWGPLIASRAAPENAVVPAALGGVAASVFALAALLLVDRLATLAALAAVSARLSLGEVAPGERSTAIAYIVVAGSLVVLVVTGMFALLGAVAGDALAQARRARARSVAQ